MMFQLLSTSNFKRNIKRFASIVCLAAIICAGVCCLNFVYHDTDVGSRVVWKGFYQQETVDTVFLGSSHVYCDIDVGVVQESMGVNAYNIATNSQSVQESYFNLLEADRLHDIDRAFVELFYYLSTGVNGDYSSVVAMQNAWRNTDNMKPGLVRARAICATNDTEHLIEAVMPYVRFRKYLFDTGYIKGIIDRKTSDSYKNYIFRMEYENGTYSQMTAQSKGFWDENTKIISDFTYTQLRKPEEMEMTADAKEYLIKIIDYCKKNDIELEFIISPMYGTQLVSTQGYDIYYNSVKEIADSYEIPFYDFNLVKKEYLPLEKDDFYDIGHLNAQGAEKYTNLLVDVIEADDAQKYFYSSYAERLREEEPYFYGIYWIEGEENRTLVMAASETDEMEFKVALRKTGEDGEEMQEVVLQEFSSQREFIIPSDEHGTARVWCRLKNDSEKIEQIEFEY